MDKSIISIVEAAKRLNCSTRQVRRYLKDGKLTAEMSPGKYGMQWNVSRGSLNALLSKRKGPRAAMDTIRLEMTKELQAENKRLMYELGQAHERIRHLESQVKLLAAPQAGSTLPWYKRLFKH